MFGTKTQKNNNTCCGAYLYFAGSEHGNLHQVSVTMSRMSYFILRANTGTGVSHSQQEKLGRGFGKMQVKGPEGSKLARKKFLAVGVASMAIYGPTPGFKG